MARLTTPLGAAAESAFVFLPFKDTHKIVLSPPAAKATSAQGPVHKCNAIWLSPTFVLLVQMTKQCTHYTVDLLHLKQNVLEQGESRANLLRLRVEFYLHRFGP